MNDTILVALISLLGTLSGTFAGILTANKLTAYRIEQLEKKVEALAVLAERTCVLETQTKLHDEKLTAASRRMDALERKEAGYRPVS